jgi:DNA polymerase bacteriophage-type
MRKIVDIDFETRSLVDLRAVATWNYSRHPSTEIMCLAYKFEDQDEVKLWHPAYPSCGIEATPLPQELFDHINNGGLVQAHNAFFEKTIWRHIAHERLSFPDIPLENYRCTAARAAMCGLPRSLEEVGIALSLEKGKDVEGRKVMLKLSKPDRHGKFRENYDDLQTLFNYCKQDVMTESLVSDLIPQMPPKELTLWQTDQDINWRGMSIDTELLEAAISLASVEKERLHNVMKSTTGIERATLRASIKTWLEVNEGLVLPDTKAKTLDKFISLAPEGSISERAQEVISLMQNANKTSVAKYDKLIDIVDLGDKKLRDTLMYHGATTGRFTSKGFQVQNLPRGKCKNAVNAKGKKYFDPDQAAEDVKRIYKSSDIENELNIQTSKWGDNLEALSTLLRGVIHAPRGKTLIAADYSSIEARVNMWLAGEKEGLAVFERGDCIYCDLASNIYGFKVIKGTHDDERQLGKQAELGLGYGMGFITFFLTCRGYGMYFKLEMIQGLLGNQYAEYLEVVKEKMQEDKKHQDRITAVQEDWREVLPELALCKYVVDIYRKTRTGIVNSWKEQETAAIKAVKTNAEVQAGGVTWFLEDGFLKCRLPSGRNLYYYSPEIRMQKTSWGEDKPTLTYIGAHKMTKRAARLGTYGGKLIENIVQGTARDLMAEAMVRVAGDPKYKLIMTVHDEIVAEVDEDKADIKDFERILCASDTWASGCPVDAEGKSFFRYQK